MSKQKLPNYPTRPPFLAQFLFVLVPWFVFTAIHLHAAGPCDPDRKFCGRILIIIEGAGAVHQKGYADESVFTKYTYSVFDRFRRNDVEAAPSFSIVIASDPDLKQKLEKLPERIKKESGLLGIVPCSIDSIDELLSNDPKISLIQRAIDNLSGCPECRRLVRAEKFGSVLPFVKTEIFIESENSSDLGGSQGIPAWATKEQIGSVEDWSRGDKKILGGDFLVRLRDRFGDGVVQLFVEACMGAKLGHFFPASNERPSCYLSGSDSDTLLAVPYRRNSIFAPVSGDIYGPQTVIDEQKNDLSRPARNIVELSAKMQWIFQQYTHSSGGDSECETNIKPIFGAADHINPLLSFAYNSADERTEKILKEFVNEDIASPLPKQLLEAEFIDQLPPSRNGAGRQDNNVPAGIVTAIARIRDSYSPYIKDDIKEVPAETRFAERLTKFRRCLKLKDPEPSVCKWISDLIGIATSGTGPHGTQSSDDINVIDRRDDVLKEFEDVDAPLLLKRYKEREITLTTLFVRLRKLWHLYDLFRFTICSYAETHYSHKPPPSLLEALKEMNDEFGQGLWDAQKQFFPLLRKNALEVRVSRIEEAAKLLAIHGDEIKGLNAKEELRLLENELVCLTAFPVGPAFDAKYEKN